MQHGTCRIEKVKAIRGGSSAVSRLKHNLREKDVDNAIEALKGENEVIIGKDSIKGVLDDIQARLDTVTETIRPDSTKVLEFLATVTSDSLEVNGGRMTPKMVEEYLADSRDFVENLYGKENVVSGIIHRDEAVPHYHFLVTPVKSVERDVRKVVSVDPETGKKTFAATGEKRKKVVLNSQDIFKDRASMCQFQEDFYNQVSKKYGLERGVRHSSKRDMRSEMMVDIEKRYNVLLEREGKNSFLTERLKTEKMAFDEDKKVLYAKDKELDKQLKSLEKSLENLEKREKQTTEREQKALKKETENAKNNEILTIREGQNKEYKEAKRTKLRGFELPEPTLMESGKAYKKRIEPLVMGKIQRALETVDNQDMRVLVAVKESKQALKDAKYRDYQVIEQLKYTLGTVKKENAGLQEKFDTMAKEYEGAKEAVLEWSFPRIEKFRDKIQTLEAEKEQKIEKSKDLNKPRKNSGLSR